MLADGNASYFCSRGTDTWLLQRNIYTQLSVIARVLQIRVRYDWCTRGST
jgi:hypothetical protein